MAKAVRKPLDCYTYTDASKCTCNADGIVKKGFLKKQKRKKFFVLRKEMKDSPARIEYYNSEINFLNNAFPNRTIELKDCFIINQRISKSGFLIVLYIEKGHFIMAAQTELEMNNWLKKLQETKHSVAQKCGQVEHNFDHVWEVSISSQVPYSEKLNGRLNGLVGLTMQSLFIIALDEYKIKTEILLQTIKDCRRQDKCTTLRTGSSSSVGKGQVTFTAESLYVAEHMYNTIGKTMNTQNVNTSHQNFKEPFNLPDNQINQEEFVRRPRFDTMPECMYRCRKDSTVMPNKQKIPEEPESHLCMSRSTHCVMPSCINTNNQQIQDKQIGHNYLPMTSPPAVSSHIVAFDSSTKNGSPVRSVASVESYYVPMQNPPHLIRSNTSPSYPKFHRCYSESTPMSKVLPEASGILASKEKTTMHSANNLSNTEVMDINNEYCSMQRLTNSTETQDGSDYLVMTSSQITNQHINTGCQLRLFTSNHRSETSRPPPCFQRNLPLPAESESIRENINSDMWQHFTHNTPHNTSSVSASTSLETKTKDSCVCKREAIRKISDPDLTMCSEKSNPSDLAKKTPSSTLSAMSSFIMRRSFSGFAKNTFQCHSKQ